jgi:UDP-glucose 4-epimerase
MRVPHHGDGEADCDAMRVLITGGAGFIGTNLCHLLAADPSVDEIVVLDDASHGDPDQLADLPVRLVPGSVCDQDALAEATEAVDAIVHLAAHGGTGAGVMEPITTQRVNVEGTVAVLEAARRAGDAHVVLASTAAIYGANPALPSHEELAPLPRTPFAASKLAAESFASAYQQTFGLPVLTLRLFDVYGRYQPLDAGEGAVVASFVRAALRGEPLLIHGDGRQTRDFVDAGTVCRIIAAALHDRVCTARPINVGSGRRTSILELAQLVAGIVGAPVLLRHHGARPGDDRDRRASIERLQTHFPRVQRTPLAEGIADMVAWARGEILPTAASV